MMGTMLEGEIRRATVTGADPHYVINGARLETYVIR
jgi:aspartate 1-decarboxylase